MEEPEEKTHKNNFEHNLKKSHLCFTSHQPPILAPNNEFCNGTIIYNTEEMKVKLEMEFNEQLSALNAAKMNETHSLKKMHNETEEKMKHDFDDDKKKLKASWTSYLVAAIFVTLILTAIAAIIVMKVCCS